MKTWRMSFRVGNQGPKMWPSCLSLGVAAITYGPLLKINLSKHPKGEPKALWAKLTPTQKASLRRVAYEMKKGDVIYVKQGPKIVGKGIVQRPYRFDTHFRLKTPDHYPWAHQVKVKWQPDFLPVKILLGSEPLTVKELSKKHLRKLEIAVKNACRSNEASIQRQEAIEGESYKNEALFRSRNRALISAKKQNSDYRCEACGISFEETYGPIGRKYIIAHHLKPVSLGTTKTTLDDIALICSNCHSMIHMENPPVAIDKLKKMLSHR